MRKALLVFSALVISTTVTAQRISWEKGENYELGSLIHTNSYTSDGWGAHPSSVAIDAPLVVMYDSSSVDSCGCNPVNHEALNGSVAIVYRGLCDFSQKAYNAQQAGAVACIVVNTDHYCMDMLKGKFAEQVTIPVLMIAKPEASRDIAGDYIMETDGHNNIEELASETLPELTLTYTKTICMSFINDAPKNGERKFYQALKWVTGKVFEIETSKVSHDDIQRFWKSYYSKIKCDGPPGGSPLAMLIAKNNFGKFTYANSETNGGLEAFCEYGLDVNLKDFNGDSITQWIEKGKKSTSDTHLRKNYAEMNKYLVEECGAKTPEEFADSY